LLDMAVMWSRAHVRGVKELEWVVEGKVLGSGNRARIREEGRNGIGAECGGGDGCRVLTGQ
jgi:hypothetical protein